MEQKGSISTSIVLETNSVTLTAPVTATPTIPSKVSTTLGRIIESSPLIMNAHGDNTMNEMNLICHEG
jgi:hypothetical protein